jgi:hypothetical protein
MTGAAMKESVFGGEFRVNESEPRRMMCGNAHR